ncbi:hypothetical protein [Candidatus Poriferisodalis sp.]|uniref:hypothetical protein n=1 Tax=Candidatus Poriferisodalis sp. TaxID=3101277 RepID=UPI003B01D8D8
MWMRLRQIAVTTADLARTAADVQSVLGVEPCFTDPGVGVFGLKNVLWPIGTQFLECVTPTRPETAAGRYQQRRSGDTGYMVITQVSDVSARRAHVERLGIRIAFEMNHADQGHVGMQLHPADTGGSFFEMDQMTGPGGDAVGGAWTPAGTNWEPYVCVDRVNGIAAAELQSPEPDRLAERWSEIAQVDLDADAAGHPTIRLDNATLRFVPETDGRGEGLGGIDVSTTDRESVLAAAHRCECYVNDSQVALAGLRVNLVDDD